MHFPMENLTLGGILYAWKLIGFNAKTLRSKDKLGNSLRLSVFALELPVRLWPLLSIVRSLFI